MTAPPLTDERSSVSPPDTAPRPLVALARRVVPLVFTSLMLAGVGGLVVRHWPGSSDRPARIAVPHAPRDPQPPPAPQVGQPATLVPAAQQVSARVDGLRQLQRALPAGTLVRVGAGWRLTRPVAVVRGGEVSIRRQRLELAAGASLDVTPGGRLTITDSSVIGLGPYGRPAAAPLPRRGFLIASGGRLVLVRDRLTDLGHLASGAGGVTFRSAARGSMLVDSALTRAFTAVLVERTHGLRVTGNSIVTPASDGLDVRSSTDVALAENTVLQPAGQAIVVSDTARRVLVAGNRIRCRAQYGIVLYDRARSVRVVGNTLAACTDAITLTQTSGDLVMGNAISGASRYGVRLSRAAASTVRANVIRTSLVGIYAYDGSTADRLIGNRFAGDTLDVRVRQDTRAIVTRPVPRNSVIGR